MSEYSEQVALTEWVDSMTGRIPELEMFTATANGGKRPQVRNQKTGSYYSPVAVKLKKSGVRAGVWDILLDCPSGQYHGFRGEMKWGRNKLSTEQEAWGERYRRRGYFTFVAYNWQEMAAAICEYLGYNVRDYVGDLERVR